VSASDIRTETSCRPVNSCRPDKSRRDGVAVRLRRLLAVVVASTAVTVTFVDPLLGGSTAQAAPARLTDPIAEVASGALVLARTTTPSFAAWRREVADEVGLRLEIDPTVLEAAWSRADAEHQIALMAALAQIGTPYRRRTSDPERGFDCSGLTTWAWAQAGHLLPRNSTQQWRAGDPRTIDTAQAGDLLRYPGHVMMWLGVGRAIVHSPQSGEFVEVQILSERSFERSRFFDPS